MSFGLAVGLALIGIAVFLVVAGRPNKAGVQPRFLRFEASLVLYPPIVMVFFAFGAAAVVSVLLGISR